MLSRQMQRWVVRSLLGGTGALQAHERRTRTDPREFDDGFLRACYELLRDLPVAERKIALLDYLATRYRNWQELFTSLMNAPPPTEIVPPSYADLQPRLAPVEWLWEGWIANRFLSALAAPPGAGKSMIALDLARRVIAGGPCPDGTPLSAPSPEVIYVDAENVPQITLQRARRWDMRLEHLYPVLPAPYQIIDLDTWRDRDRLIEMTATLHPGLIVVDSLSMVSTRGDSSVEEVRPVLSFLAGLADQAGCAVLLIHHTRKRPQMAPADLEMRLDDVRGSGHIIAACRTVLGLNVVQRGPSSDPNGPRKLQVLKTNLGVCPPPLGVEFVPHGADGVSVRYGLPLQPYRAPTAADQCAQWLLDTLRAAAHPLKPADVVRAARAAGFSRSLVYEVRYRLGARIVCTGGPKSHWRLADTPE